VREFKRSLDLDPTLPQSGETFSTIFGADSKVMQSQVIPVVSDWAREDLRDTDRLFLLGLLLHFDEDPRGSEIMEAALRTPGANDYFLAFVNPAGTSTSRPRSRERREPGLDVHEGADLPPSPVPMLEAPVEPFPDPPPT
jgi:hypothetical protein